MRADSTVVSAPTTISVTYFSMSGVKAGIAKDKPVYNTGDNVGLRGQSIQGNVSNSQDEQHVSVTCRSKRSFDTQGNLYVADSDVAITD